MMGERHLDPVDKLLLDRRDPDEIERARMVLDAIRENFAGYNFQTTIHRTDGDNTVEIHVVSKGHENMHRVIADASEHWFGIDVEHCPDVNGNDCLRFVSDEWF